jgi:hypothetical protein
MKTFTLAAVLFVAIVGMAMAFIRPAQPVQVAQTPAFVGLDNPAVASDGNIHPARKCTSRKCSIKQKSTLFSFPF